MLSFKIVPESMGSMSKHDQNVDDEVVVENEDGDGTMKHYVEEQLLGAGNVGAGGGIAGMRRTSTRINSLLFEEDSLQIKREMVR